MYSDKVAAFQGQAAWASAIETGTKFYISNLDYGVSNDDIKGTAEVVFSWRTDAMVAVKRYNNVQLDGKPMKIEIVGTNLATSAATAAANGAFGSSNGAARGGRGFGRRRGGAGGRGIRRGHGRGKGCGEKVSAEDLDADLEKYHSEAMQTN